jgi:hypothetical protein
LAGHWSGQSHLNNGLCTIFLRVKKMGTIMKHSDDHKEVSTPIVTHVTQITVSLLPDDGTASQAVAGSETVTPAMVKQLGKDVAERYSRVASMMELLASHGFSFRRSNKAVHCFSSEVEAGEAKRLLLAAGFNDREFQIVLEYTRGWGML